LRTVDLDIDALTDLALITGAGGQQLARTIAVMKNRILVLDAKRKSPVHFGRGWKSPIYLDIDTGTRPPDLNTRFSHATALLDGYITVATSADGQVAVFCGRILCCRAVQHSFLCRAARRSLAARARPNPPSRWR